MVSSELPLLPSLPKTVIVKEGVHSPLDVLPAETPLSITTANRAELEIRGEVKAENQTENVEGAADTFESLFGRGRAIQGGAPVLPSAIWALVVLVFEWGALQERLL